MLDSPVDNACSHFLHNMFFVLGPRMDRSDEPTQVQAELYRANLIDNYDTAAIRCVNRSGAELLLITSHATQNSQEPLIHYQFEHSEIRYAGGDDNPEMVGHLSDGSTIRYGKPLEAIADNKLHDMCAAIRSGNPVPCGLEASASQTACMFAAQQSMPIITAFPQEMIVVEGEEGQPHDLRQRSASRPEQLLRKLQAAVRNELEMGQSGKGAERRGVGNGFRPRGEARIFRNPSPHRI